MSVDRVPTEALRGDVEDLRWALREVVEAMHLIAQDVSDALVLQHIDAGLGSFGRNHVELIVSLQGAAKSLQQLSLRLEAGVEARN